MVVRFAAAGYPTRDQARTASRELRSRTIASNGLTVGEWFEQWLGGRTNLRASTRRNYRSHLDLHLLPAIGDLRLADLDTVRIQAAFDKLAAPGAGGRSTVSPVGLHRVRAALRTMLNAAVRAGLLTANPARQVFLAPASRPHPVVWTQERIREWERAGIRPAVAVWTAEQTAQFLTTIHESLRPLSGGNSKALPETRRDRRPKRQVCTAVRREAAHRSVPLSR